jgi:hypothetical protein
MVGHPITQSNNKNEIEAIDSQMVLAAEITRMKRERMRPRQIRSTAPLESEATSG